ncbi:protein XRI1-like [Dioscorea cayenensis subsp. rotundata]|uniref:Protein XRI1-like n=1 Tax=Dioscorea cayennensis subsp. rotundata TaxID=55577 RepID=A0AB40C4A4_DIOCR|nr:protein XRI1-like [Dioscorea cayenensis subsp. rotundata]XP_039133692.1 protein XRI1-like [Dioscorea cayenensis subsp. rotundata]XP_039133693.1 protein XRI1-like [Dioscorea cayenensis subsp. rotundata]
MGYQIKSNCVLLDFLLMIFVPYNDEGFNKSTEVLLQNCLNESEMPNIQNEMNYHMVSYKQNNISELCNIPPDTGNEVVHKTHTLNPCRIFKGRKSYIETPTKSTTSVAYPFALIKPCGVQGHVTLKDINQLIHASPPSKSMNKIDEDSSMSYPTSAFSGKPVVVQTKLRTEGGKGSITIMRTKG